MDVKRFSPDTLSACAVCNGQAPVDSSVKAFSWCRRCGFLGDESKERESHANPPAPEEVVGTDRTLAEAQSRVIPLPYRADWIGRQ